MRDILLIIGLVTIFGCNNSIKKNEKLVHALQDTTLTNRGNLIKIAENEFRFDYYDVSEKDSHSDYLQNLGFQGGGYSWEGIVYGAVKLSEPKILNTIRFNPEAEGLAIWSTDKGSLEKIGRLIAVVKSDNEILTDCINVAKKRFRME